MFNPFQPHPVHNPSSPCHLVPAAKLISSRKLSFLRFGGGSSLQTNSSRQLLSSFPHLNKTSQCDPSSHQSGRALHRICLNPLELHGKMTRYFLHFLLLGMTTSPRFLNTKIQTPLYSNPGMPSQEGSPSPDVEQRGSSELLHVQFQHRQSENAPRPSSPESSDCLS